MQQLYYSQMTRLSEKSRETIAKTMFSLEHI